MMRKSVSIADAGPPVHSIGVDERADSIRILSLMALAGAHRARYNLHASSCQPRVKNGKPPAA